MRDRRWARRWWVLGLSACAAGLAASIVLTPRVIGNQIGPPTDLSFLNVVEGGTVDHAGDHLAATPEATARAAARKRYCAQESWRAEHEAFCPEDAPTPREARTIQAAGLTQSPLSTTEADGSWGPLLHIPTTAIHAVLMHTGKVLWFSQPKYPTEQDASDGGTAHVWDPATNTTRSVPPPSVTYPVSGPGGATATRPANLWCAGQTLLSDGRVLVVGGNLEYPEDTGTGSGNGGGNGFKGAPWVMTFDPVTETWTRYRDMPHGRWYPTLTELPDGRVLIVGGWDETGGRDNGGAAQPALMDNDQDVEVFDPATPAGGQATTVVSKLPPDGPGQPTPYPDHRGLGLYPHVFVLPSTTTLGAGGDKVLVAGPTRYDSAVIDTTSWLWTDVISEHPDTGQARLSQDRAWGTAWLAPSDTNGSTSVVLLGGADTAGVAPGPGSRPPGRRHVRDPRPRSGDYRPGLGLEAGRHARPQHRPGPLQHHPPAGRLDPQQRRRLRPPGQHPLRRPGLRGRAAHPREPHVARRGHRGRRPHVPLHGTASARRLRSLGGR